jgi:hypothetical protein
MLQYENNLGIKLEQLHKYITYVYSMQTECY